MPGCGTAPHPSGWLSGGDRAEHRGDPARHHPVRHRHGPGGLQRQRQLGLLCPGRGKRRGRLSHLPHSGYGRRRKLQHVPGGHRDQIGVRRGPEHGTGDLRGHRHSLCPLLPAVDFSGLLHDGRGAGGLFGPSLPGRVGRLYLLHVGGQRRPAADPGGVLPGVPNAAAAVGGLF